MAGENGPGSFLSKPRSLLDQITQLLQSAVGLATAITAFGGVFAGLLWFIASRPEIAVIVLVVTVIVAVLVWWRRPRDRRVFVAGDAAIRGLQAFRDGDAELLTSLDQQTTELLTAVDGPGFGFGVLYGDPNVGKTSFVAARLIPAFKTAGGKAAYLEGVGVDLPNLEQPIASKICEALAQPIRDARLATVLDDLKYRDVREVLIVWDAFDEVVTRFPDRAERVRALQALRPLVNDAEHRVRLLFVLSTSYREVLATDLVGAFGRQPDDESELKRLETQTAIDVLKQFVDHDAKLGLPRLSGGVCERIGRGLAQGGSVCPAELQIVADQLRERGVQDEAGLRRVGGVRGVFTAFISARLSAQGSPTGLVRGVLSQLAGCSVGGVASVPVALSRDEIATALGPANDADRTNAIQIVLDDLVKNDLAVCTPERKYTLVHPYMKQYVLDALNGLRPPAPTFLDQLAANAPRVGSIAVIAAVLAGALFVLASWFTWGPHARSTLQTPTLAYGRVAFDPQDRYVLAQATPPDSILVWDRSSPATDSPSLNCGTNPSVLTTDFPGGLGRDPTLQSAEFSRDGHFVRAIGTSISAGRLWILTWSLEARCDAPTLLAGDYPIRTDSGVKCVAQDVAYSETLQKVAVAYAASDDADAPETCRNVALLPVQQATELGDGSGASLTALGRRTQYTPMTLAIEPATGNVLVLTQGTDQHQYSESFDMQLRPGPVRAIQQRGGYGIAIVNGHMNVVVEVDPVRDSQPFWTRPPLSWFTPQQGAWIEDWDSDVNLLRFWISGAIQGNRPPAGFSADGKWLVVIRDGPDQTVYEMTSELAGYNLPTLPLPFLS